MSHFKLIRYQNLILIALMQVFIKYGLFHPFGIDITLSNFNFALLVLATLCIAAAGNIINDIYDVSIDNINKPEQVLIGKKISEKSAFTFFIILNVIGVGIGFYLSSNIGKPEFASIFIVISALLYLYASYLKSMFIIGNIVISTLVASSLIIVGLFDLLPAITPENQATQSTIFSIVLDYALFAFLINLIREIVKDIQDMDGDKNGGMNTIPIVLGRKRANYIVFSLGILALFIVVYFTYTYLYHSQLAVLYFLLLIVAPLIYFCVKAFSAQYQKEFSFLSKLLKLIMFFGMCSILIYQYVILK